MSDIWVDPDHYKGFSIETIDMMVKIWGAEKVAIHCEITAFKYRMRAGMKTHQPATRDIEKADWYINKAKELREELSKRA